LICRIIIILNNNGIIRDKIITLPQINYHHSVIQQMLMFFMVSLLIPLQGTSSL